MLDQFLRSVILKNVWMIDILKLISSLIGVCFHTHHNKRFQRIEDSFSPGWAPVVIPCYDVLDYFIISLSCEREICMIKGIQNYSDIPQLAALLNGWLIILLDLFRGHVLSMIVLLFMKPFLLHVHQMPEVDDFANFLLLLRPDSTWPL